MKRSAVCHTPQARAYSLAMTMMLMAMLAAAAAAIIVSLNDASATTASAINQRQAFYACDSVTRVAVIKAREYLQSVAVPTTAGLMTAVCGNASACPSASAYAPAGFNIDSLALTVGASSSIAPLPNGPFKGMNAQQTMMTISVEATKLATDARCRVDETVVLGQIGLFQFFVFADGYMDLFNGASMEIEGRVHVNGDWCSHGLNSLKIEHLTASGHIRDSCGNKGSPFFGNQRTQILVAGTGPFNTGQFRTLEAAGQSGCTTCTPEPGVGSWLGYSTARWAGNVQDSFHGVPSLRMPFVGSAAVPDGKDQSGGAIDNSTRMRAIIDPVMPGDAPGVRAQKLAMQASIRIINGVWSKDNGSWPGVPIWSDHPLNYTTKGDDGNGAEVSGLQVGQQQLFPSGTVPRRYSYYEYNRTAGQLFDGTLGGPASVISYGTLMRVSSASASPSRYTPGFHLTNTAGSFCNNAGSGTDAVVPYTTICGTGSAAEGLGSALLQGTRGGMQDPRVRGGVTGADANKYRMLPLNFDVEAFTAALQDLTSGELGAHFSGGATFNGIVYIANLWPGSTNNMNASSTAQTPPPLWPNVHSSNTAGAGEWANAQPSVPTALPLSSGAAGSESTRLPMNLCGDGLVNTPLASATRFTGRGSFATFIVPSCTDGFTASTTDDDPSRPNSVRIIHAATINPTVFPKGLSIVSNGPVYLMGNTNTSSQGQLPANSGGNWRPLLVAGDATTFVSNAWQDNDLDWADDPSFSGARTAPTDTTYVVTTIAGNVETSSSDWGGGVNNFPRFIEKWSNTPVGGPPSQTTVIIGSLVSAFRSVYAWQKWDVVNGSVSIYNPPTRNWAYDENLALPVNQPPGTPSFVVQAVQNWKRD